MKPPGVSTSAGFRPRPHLTVGVTCTVAMPPLAIPPRDPQPDCSPLPPLPPCRAGGNRALGVPGTTFHPAPPKMGGYRQEGRQRQGTMGASVTPAEPPASLGQGQVSFLGLFPESDRAQAGRRLRVRRMGPPSPSAAQTHFPTFLPVPVPAAPVLGAVQSPCFGSQRDFCLKAA